MDIKTNKIKKFSMHALYFLSIFLLPMTSSAFTNCNGKAFQCLNSTHFMVCVDIGNGVSIALTQYHISCPDGTECQVGNNFQCEQIRTTTVVSDVTNEMQRIVSAEDDVTNIGFVSEESVRTELTSDTSQTESITPNIKEEENTQSDTTTENFRILSDTTTMVHAEQSPTDNQIEHSLNPVEITTSEPEISTVRNIPENNDITTVESTITTHGQDFLTTTATINTESFEITTENINYKAIFEDTSTFKSEIETVTEQPTMIPTDIIINTESILTEAQATTERELMTVSNNVVDDFTSDITTDNLLTSTIFSETLTTEALASNTDINEFQTFTTTQDLTTYENINVIPDSTYTTMAETFTTIESVNEVPDSTYTTVPEVSTTMESTNEISDSSYTTMPEVSATMESTNEIPDSSYTTMPEVSTTMESTDEIPYSLYTTMPEVSTTMGTTNEIPDSTYTTMAETFTTIESVNEVPDSTYTTVPEVSTTMESTNEISDSSYTTMPEVSATMESTNEIPDSSYTTMPEVSTTMESTNEIPDSSYTTMPEVSTTMESTDEIPYSLYTTMPEVSTTMGTTNEIPDSTYTTMPEVSTTMESTNEISDSSYTTMAETSTTIESTNEVSDSTYTTMTEVSITTDSTKITNANEYDTVMYTDDWTTETSKETTGTTPTYESDTHETSNPNFYEDATHTDSINYVTTEIVTNNPNTHFHTITQTGIFDDKTNTITTINDLNDNEIRTTTLNTLYESDNQNHLEFKPFTEISSANTDDHHTIKIPITEKNNLFDKTTTSFNLDTTYTVPFVMETSNTVTIAPSKVEEETTKFESLKTTTQKSEQNAFTCVSEGRFRDYEENNIYYICVKGKDNKLYEFKFQCLIGYFLDKNSVKCFKNELTSKLPSTYLSTVSYETASTVELITNTLEKQHIINNSEKSTEHILASETNNMFTTEANTLTDSLSTAYLENTEVTNNPKTTTQYFSNNPTTITNAEFVCKKEGRFLDDFESNVYHICVKGKDNKLYNFKFRCQIGYSLDRSSIKCFKNVLDKLVESTTEHYKDQSTDNYPKVTVNQKVTGAYTSIETNKPIKDITASIAQTVSPFTGTLSTVSLRNSEPIIASVTPKFTEFVCLKEGRFMDNLIENVYYVCVKGSDNKLYKFKFICQTGYYLDKTCIKCIKQNIIQEITVSTTQTISPFADTLSTISLRNSEPIIASVTPKDIEYICLKEGRFLDNIIKNVYYVCVKGSDNKLYKFKFICQLGYYLDKNNIKCVKEQSFLTTKFPKIVEKVSKDKQNVVESPTTKKSKAFECISEGRFYDHFINNVYYVCVKGSDNKLYGFKYICQTGYYLDKVSIKCMKNAQTTKASANYGTVVEEKPIYTTTEQYTQKEAVFDCSGKESGTYSDIKDCSKFYTCAKNKLSIHYCPNKSVFSEVKEKCTRNLSHCVRNNMFQCTAEGRFSDLKKENVYYICVKGKDEKLYRFHFQCKSGYVLDKSSVKCFK